MAEQFHKYKVRWRQKTRATSSAGGSGPGGWAWREREVHLSDAQLAEAKDDPASLLGRLTRDAVIITMVSFDRVAE